MLSTLLVYQAPTALFQLPTHSLVHCDHTLVTAWSPVGPGEQLEPISSGWTLVTEGTSGWTHGGSSIRCWKLGLGTLDIRRSAPGRRAVFSGYQDHLEIEDFDGEII